MSAPATSEASKEDLKTQFITREGLYKVVALSDCMRQNRNSFNGQCNTPVKISFINFGDKSGGCGGVGKAMDETMCFNLGKELYFYQHKGVRKAVDLTKPIDKRAYRGTSPTCHDFNCVTGSPDSVMIVVGFSAGQVQLIDPLTKELSKLYNEERLTDKTKVTCIRWVPGSTHQFVVSHASGQLYLYNKDLPCSFVAPHYQPFKCGDGFSIHTCKTKSACNPVYRWVIGEGAINEFAFSPCSKNLAIVSEDGFLRVFNYESMELIGVMKSYFGGLLCVCWSPDGRYIVTGGEDDLVTVWSFAERRVICRGRGHKSWVSVVAFDLCSTTSGDASEFVGDFCGSDDDFCRFSPNSLDTAKVTTTTTASSLPNAALHANSNGQLNANVHMNGSLGSSHSLPSSVLASSYRFGSVGHDTLLCLWDLTDEILHQPTVRPRTNTIISQTDVQAALPSPRCTNVTCSQATANCVPNDVHHAVDGNVNTILSSPPPTANCNFNSSTQSGAPTTTTGMTQKFATLALGERNTKEHKWHFSLASRSSDSKIQLLKANLVKPVDESVRLLGTPACPRLGDAPLLEPLICKKIAQERLTALVFREDCFVTACQDGVIYTWARPGKAVSLAKQPTQSSPQSSINSTAL